MSFREEQCNKVCRILDYVLANRPTERDSLITAVRIAFSALNCSEIPNSSDSISRRRAIDAIRASTQKYTGFMEMEMYTDDDAVEAIINLPSVKPDSKESSLTQKALDSISRADAINMVYGCEDEFGKDVVFRFADYIRQLPSVQSKQLQVLADVLDGCPLTYPCDKMWRGGWCEEHCRNNKLQKPNAECWLKYAEVMAADDT